jgi:hypothetical protein
MILFPKSEHEYTDAAQPAQRVIIDTVNAGDLYPVRASLGSSRADWRVLLCGRVARNIYGNATFHSRDAAVAYMKVVVAEFHRVAEV